MRDGVARAALVVVGTLVDGSMTVAPVANGIPGSGSVCWAAALAACRSVGVRASE